MTRKGKVMNQRQSPVVERFQIFGLHGYKDVTINFTDTTKIIIAENGSGKTTILNTLDAFLRADYALLLGIEFDKIVCKFACRDEEVTLDRSSVAFIAKSHSGETMKQISRFSSSSTNYIHQFITTIYRPDESDAWMRSNVAHEIFVSSPFDWNELRQYFDQLKAEIESVYSDELRHVNSSVAESLSGVDLLYLPTYRRVEKPMTTESAKATRRRVASLGRRSGRDGYSELNIRYGLDDVQNTLTELSQEIQQKTNAGYRKISKEIIDDLLERGLTVQSGGPPELPKLDVLKRFFSRVGEISNPQVARIERVYAQEADGSDNSEAAQLVYFLSKLATVVNETYQLEATIEEFTEIANSYLGATSDPKALVYDPVDMAVSVVDSWTGSSLELNDLSSGEKQVVSLVAHLYLEARNKIVLIDEPELSLSIEWQRKILLDIARSPRCKQLLAITHSPFVFDNEMDGLATSLDVTRRRLADA
jgi:ABC-type cobalamin/Fe3+-siderophores transport system ATPase subunit